MTNVNQQKALCAVVATALLLVSTSADAFRCGRKLVIENMHEAQVLKACGLPTTSRNLGYTTRDTYLPIRHKLSPGLSTKHFPAYGPITEQVVLTEYVYNFGPRKFMQRLTFEGGILTRIEHIGYGYREKKSK